MSNELLKKLHFYPFKPLPFFSSGKAQTLLTFFYPSYFDQKPTRTHTVTLPDQDKLVVMEYRPKRWKPGDRAIVLIHGLTGDYRSKYIVRMSKEWYKQGMLIIRVNLRGCGPGVGLARHPYHSGRSEDARAVIRWLYHRYPSSPVTLVGFSLGGNITLKMAAEVGSEQLGGLDSVMAVSPPVDLHACSALLHKSDNEVFEKYFVQSLVDHSQTQRKYFPEIPEIEYHRHMSLQEFDDIYTAPFSGFDDAIDYYTRSSSGMILDRIKLPTFILYAKDDPFITIERFLDKMTAPNFDILVTEHGGHIGWLGPSIASSKPRWMDDALIHWLNWFMTEKHTTEKASS